MKHRTDNALQSEMDILTSLAIRDGLNLGPSQTAIQRACEMKSVQRIHILSETPFSVAILTLPVLQHPKITFVAVATRPTFADLFNYCNQIELVDNAVVAVMNSDISFADECDIQRAVHALNLARDHGHHAVLALTRHEIVDGKAALILHDTTGLPNCVTADCWVFRPPVLPVDVDYFSLGDMNCDSLLAYNLAEAGYCLINPCLDVTIIHHEEVKSSSYYSDLNDKQRSTELLGWHWAKRCNHSYKTYGAPWTKSTAAGVAYLPLPLIYQKSRIYIVFSRTMSTNFCLPILALTEIISRMHERDLVVLYENDQNIVHLMMEQLGSVTRNAYLLPVNNIDDTIESLISEENLYGESCALISRLDYLTGSLIREFHSIVFDGRMIDTAARISCPAGHANLRIFAEARYPHIQFEAVVNFVEEYADSGQCTLITSIFQSDDFIAGFKKNITALNDYEITTHALLFSNTSEKERSLLNSWHYEHPNVILCWFKKDPGLYECWNIGIRLAQTDFVSNANVDDLRHPDHVRLLKNELRSNNGTSVAATAVVPFFQYIDEIKAIDSTKPWYAEQAGIFRFEDLARLEQGADGFWKLIPHNIPHCMPVWRKSLHERYGFFDEKKYGTYADWAFWLKVMKAGEVGYLSHRAYTYYFVNQNSHNRRGDHLEKLHKAVEHEFIADFYFKTKEPWPRKLILEGLSQSFGQHRNSFNRLIETLRPLHIETGGIRFIPFIERYFVWGTDDGEAASASPEPIQQDWIGILHVPFDAPKWFEYNVSPESIFATDLWRNSVSHCRGIICLTEDLCKDLYHAYPSLPSLTVKHPTELDVIPFNWDAYVAKPRLVQAGDWLRRLQYIYELDAPDHHKILLKKANTAEWMRREIEVIGDHRNETVTVLDFVSNQKYDELLSSSVVVAWLYGSAANNIVLECIARRTPILINPLPSIIEYLGKDYPLYLTDRNKGSSFIRDRARIKAAHDYLVNDDSLREKLSYQSFLCAIATSNFYTNL